MARDAVFGVKITFPYIGLALLFSLAAAYIVITLVFENLEARFRSQLLVALQITADLMVSKENELLAEVRAIAFTEGVAESLLAGDAEQLRLLTLPLAANSGLEAVDLLGPDGVSVLSLHKTPGGGAEAYTFLRGERIYLEWPFVQTTLAQQVDLNNAALSNKYAGSVEAPWGRLFYVSGPVYSADKQFAGVVLVGVALESLAEEFKREVSAEAITFYDPSGSQGLIHLTACLPINRFWTPRPWPIWAAFRMAV